MIGRAEGFRGAGRSLVRALPGLAPTFLIVAVLACVLVPLPTALVDLLLSSSLAGGVLLLVASMTIARTTEFLSFPSLLLLVTLFRLALNVSTTRLILSQADAGRVIEAFSSFVAGNDLIVGGVMFAIITIVQYVVIARGAERVAEVAARFALDALPGHQAAIDADLRAGIISAGEAAQRRARLAERSGFYGAMDGAIRFVKGDAIAGLAITAVNIVGGLAIGVSRMDYGWGQSLAVYGRLTIGDGLLAQIPALLVSLAAGVLVSRVDTGRGYERTSWLKPPMLLVPAVMLLGLAMVPALPALAFVTTAAGLVVGAVLLSMRASAARRLRPPHVHERKIFVRVAEPDAGDARNLDRALAEVRMRCSAALGIEVPAIVLRVDRRHPRGLIEVSIDERLRTRTPAGHVDADAVVLTTFRAVMEHAEALFDLQDLDRAIEQVRATHPAIVKRALEVLSPPDLLMIIGSLLRERIPLPPMRIMLSVVARSRRLSQQDARHRWSDIARAELAPFWLVDVLDALFRLGPPRWVRLEPDAEDELCERLTVGDDGSTLALTPTERAQWHAQLRRVVDPAPSGTAGEIQKDGPPGPIVVLTTPKARRALAELFADLRPHVPVLSTAELHAARAPLPEAVRWLASP